MNRQILSSILILCFMISLNAETPAENYRHRNIDGNISQDHKQHINRDSFANRSLYQLALEQIKNDNYSSIFLTGIPVGLLQSIAFIVYSSMLMQFNGESSITNILCCSGLIACIPTVIYWLTTRHESLDIIIDSKYMSKLQHEHFQIKYRNFYYGQNIGLIPFMIYSAIIYGSILNGIFNLGN